jgi:hypothetical protein
MVTAIVWGAKKETEAQALFDWVTTLSRDGIYNLLVSFTTYDSDMYILKKKERIKQKP